MDLLLQVVAHLKRVYRPITCRIIGSGPEREGLRAQAARLGLADEVEFLTDVTDLADLLRMGRLPEGASQEPHRHSSDPPP